MKTLKPDKTNPNENIVIVEIISQTINPNPPPPKQQEAESKEPTGHNKSIHRLSHTVEISNITRTPSGPVRGRLGAT
jgi:hypothetical protein